MEAKELRLGNLVKIGASIYPVITISKDEIQASGYSRICPLNLVNPVPLTEEWFKRAKFERSRYLAPGVDEVIFSLHDINIVCREKNEGYYLQETMTKLLYVHHLQNLLFSLRGIELEIQENL